MTSYQTYPSGEAPTCPSMPSDTDTVAHDALSADEGNALVLRKLQEEELEILKDFDAWCKRHNLSYWLDSGTLLGGIRHKGFIPWDDDIDLGMMRSDYDRMLELAQDDFPDGLCLATTLNTPGDAALFAKVYKQNTLFETQETREAGCKQGIFIDIFPYDALAKDEVKRARQISKAYRCQQISYIYHAKSIKLPHAGLLGIIERILVAVVRPVLRLMTSPQALMARFNKEAILDASECTDEVATLVYGVTKPLRRADFLPTSELEFESCVFPAPAHPERYLEVTYGDWRRIPKEDERHTHLPLRLVFSDGSEWRA